MPAELEALDASVEEFFASDEGAGVLAGYHHSFLEEVKESLERRGDRAWPP